MYALVLDLKLGPFQFLWIKWNLLGRKMKLIYRLRIKQYTRHYFLSTSGLTDSRDVSCSYWHYILSPLRFTSSNVLKLKFQKKKTVNQQIEPNSLYYSRVFQPVISQRARLSADFHVSSCKWIIWGCHAVVAFHLHTELFVLNERACWCCPS